MADLFVDPRTLTAENAVDPRRTVLPVLEGLARALGYDRGFVALYDPARSSLRGAVGLNVPDQIVEALEIPLEATQSPVVTAFTTGRAVLVEDVATSPEMRENTIALLLEMEIGACLIAPFRDPFDSTGTTAPIDEAAPMGVVVLSREDPITEVDVGRVMPFAVSPGTALAEVPDRQTPTDSSERYAIENEWMWLMLTTVGDPVVLTDESNDIILQNRRAEDLFRAALDDSEGKRRALQMNNFLFTAELSSANLDRRDTGREITLVDPIEGTELLFEVISHKVTNYRNGTRGTVSVLKNITDLRRATEQLTQNVQRLQTVDEEIRRERDRLNLLLRSVPNPIIVMGEDSQIVTMNEEAQRLFRVPPGSTNPRRAQICVSNDTRFSLFVAQLRLDNAQVRHGELVLTDPETEDTLPMDVTSTEIRDERGIGVATMSVLQDVSRVRELERRRVEQVLFESEKLAATGRLAASIAHEINNPLEAIKNSLYLLNSRVTPENPDYKFLQIATKETERVSRILRQMLGFYRTGVKMESTDINGIIIEAEQLVQKHMQQRRVRIEKDLAPNLPSVIASADQMKQVILNLFMNAQQAMPDGGTITVSTHAAHAADPEFMMSDAVHIRVRDTGQGIPDDVLPHIFEPFFSTKQEQRGTGLGLWVTNGIVQSHGGSIRIRSRVGRGTTFSIALPIGGPSANE